MRVVSQKSSSELSRSQLVVREKSEHRWISLQNKCFDNSNSRMSRGYYQRALAMRNTNLNANLGVQMQEESLRQDIAETRIIDLFGTGLRTQPVSFRKANATILSFSEPARISIETKQGTWLEDVLVELGGCGDLAAEEDLPEPSSSTLLKAEYLLKELSKCVTAQPDVYPMDEGSIAIDLRKPNTRSGVLFLIEQDGSGALFYRTQKSKGRVRVDDAGDLLREGGLFEIRRVGIV